MGNEKSCFKCKTYRAKENNCENVCVYNRLKYGAFAEDLPRHKGKLCNNFKHGDEASDAKKEAAM